jgi:glycosyltransferase involved in cell wall biosynthesis
MPTGNAEAMSHAIRQLILNPEQRIAFAAAGKAKAKQKFSWDNVANAYENIFENTLPKKQDG